MTDNWKHICRRMPWGLLLCVLIQPLSATVAVADEPVTAAELLAEMRKNIEKTESIECTMQYLQRPTGDPNPEKIVTKHYTWGFESDTGREYAIGKYVWRYPDGEGGVVSRGGSERVVYNGVELRTYHFDSQNGSVGEKKDSSFNAALSPKHLWLIKVGIGPKRKQELIFAPDGKMGQAELIQLEGTPSHVKVLRLLEDHGPEKSEYTLWIDTKRGHMPIRFENYRIPGRTAPGVLSHQKIFEQLDEVAPDIWLPTKVQATGFFLSRAIYPDGQTEEQWGKSKLKTMLSPEKLKLLDTLNDHESFVKLVTEQQMQQMIELFKKECHYEIKELGCEGGTTITIDPESISINQPIDEANFQLDFYIGDDVYNEFLRKGYRVGGDDAPKNRFYEE